MDKTQLRIKALELAISHPYQGKTTIESADEYYSYLVKESQEVRLLNDKIRLLEDFALDILCLSNEKGIFVSTKAKLNEIIGNHALAYQEINNKIDHSY